MLTLVGKQTILNLFAFPKLPSDKYNYIIQHTIHIHDYITSKSIFAPEFIYKIRALHRYFFRGQNSTTRGDAAAAFIRNIGRKLWHRVIYEARGDRTLAHETRVHLIRIRARAASETIIDF